MRKIVILLIICGLLTAVPGYASNSKTGTTGAQFLKIGVGGRATGMGGAYTGIAEDVSAIYWNPGGLGLLKTKEVMFVYNSWFQDITHQFLGFGLPLGKIGTFGLGVTLLTVGDMEKRVADTAEKVGTFKAQDMSLAIAYAKRMTENISLGANVKYIGQKIDDESASGMAVDLGSLIKTPVNNLTIGLAVANIGPGIKFVDESDPLPLSYKVGAGYKLLKDTLTLGLDVIYPIDNDITVASGIEYGLKFGADNVLAIRTGYRTGMESGGLSGLGAGIGFMTKAIGIDVTWTPYGDLGDTYRGTMRIKF